MILKQEVFKNVRQGRMVTTRSLLISNRDKGLSMNFNRRLFMQTTMLRLLLGMVATFALLSLLSSAHSETPGEKALPDDLSVIGAKWGVKVLGLKLSGGGFMLDFRYRVTDADKARPLFDKKVKPYLVDQATGTRLLVPNSPKLGALRQTPKNPVPDKNYFVLFANPGQIVKAGNKVAVVIGDFRVENLRVE